MRRPVLCSAVVALAIPGGVLSFAQAASGPTQLALLACPNVTQTIYPAPAPSNDDLSGWTTRLGCFGPVVSGGYVDCSGTPHPNTDLGAFRTSQNPLGLAVQLNARPTCGSDPGAGVGNGELAVTVTKTGFCPQTSTVAARTGSASVIFPIGSLSLGAYEVTVAFPGQGALVGTHATGTLHMGGVRFTETDTTALAKSNAFAVLLDNSIAGRGAGALTVTRAGTKAHLVGTDYYACGAINVDATVRLAKHRVTGDGLITGGSGNYKDLKGSFTVKGSYNARTGRGTLTLKGIATY